MVPGKNEGNICSFVVPENFSAYSYHSALSLQLGVVFFISILQLGVMKNNARKIK